MYEIISNDDLETYEYVQNDLLIFQNEMISFSEEEDSQGAKDEIYFNLSSISNEKQTSIKTNQTEFHYKKKNNSPSPKNKAIYDDKLLDNCCSFEKIQKIFAEDEKKFKDIYQKFTYDYNIESAEDKLCKRKRNRQMEDYFFMEDELKQYNKIKRGRARKTNNKFYEEHTKMSGDNIIRKIKVRLFAYLLQFLNNILNKKDEDKNRLYKLNYKFIKNLNKKKDIKYLNIPLKDLFSMNITPRYKGILPDYNKEFIERIINHEERVEDYNTVIFVFNMTFREWLDMFTCKKDINYLKNKCAQCDGINFEMIANKIAYVNKLLEKMLKKNDERYFSIFTFYLYNYENWFSIQSSRSSKKQKQQ